MRWYRGGACLVLTIAALQAGWLVQPAAATAQGAAEPPSAAPPADETHQGGAKRGAKELQGGRVGRLIEQFTYVAIITVLLLCGLGLPLPEEVPILTSAVLSRVGHLHPWWALGACMLGVMVGDSVMFLLGRHWGPHVLEHRLSRKLLTPERREKILAYFERYGAWIIFAARFLPGIRAPLFLTAGSMKVSFRIFFLMDGAAALVSIPTSFWLAYIFTDKLEQVLGARDKVQHWALGVIAAGLVISIVVHRVIARRRARAAATAPAATATEHGVPKPADEVACKP